MAIDAAAATVMITTYNRLNLTKKTFETTLKNAGCKYNLIIVDNASMDGTVEWLNSNLKTFDLQNYHVAPLNKNMGIAYGRNLGLKICDEHFPDTDFLCTLDNDVVLPDNWLIRCCNVLKSMDKIVACGINLEDRQYPKTKLRLINGEYETIQIKPLGNLGTAAMVFSAASRNRLGFFENYECYGHEDALWGFRLRQISGGNLTYLEEPGIHLGVEAEDSGEYRQMKNKYWDINMKKFERDIRLYANGIKPLYAKFENYDKSLEKDVLIRGRTYAPNQS